MSPVSLRLRAVPRLRREVHEAVYGAGMWVRSLEVRGHDGCEEYLGRFKRAPVAPTNLHRQSSRRDPNTFLFVKQGVTMYAPRWEGLAERGGDGIV